MTDIKKGTVFDTPAESGCVALTEPDENGDFNALDSDGVECQFNIVMVQDVRV